MPFPSEIITQFFYWKTQVSIKENLPPKKCLFDIRIILSRLFLSTADTAKVLKRKEVTLLVKDINIYKEKSLFVRCVPLCGRKKKMTKSLETHQWSRHRPRSP